MFKKKLFLLFCLPFILGLFMLNGCGIVTPEVAYNIGDTGPSGVGIVFYITDGGLHGMEAAPSDQSTSMAWSNINDTEIGTTAQGTAIGTGAANTDAIIAQAGHMASAAKLCRDYDGGGETDWFLPSKDELNQLYTKKAVVGGFAGDGYWSSSEYDAYYAWDQYFGIGDQDDYHKNYDLWVRAVRAF
jgi:hypothetical protein